ncbi:MAG: hypothetical protein FD152_396 [Xanthobacteraceae bacterium]|nr:MAG: hypothetical protein FD152_396 [Xanthobacteraceae bacterium]
MTAGTVYCLTNPSIPSAVKIGLTRGPVLARAAALFSTGVPTPFDVAFAIEVADCRSAERTAHRSLGQFRVHPRREFFLVSVEDARTAVTSVAHEDVTERELDRIVTPTERAHALVEEEASGTGFYSDAAIEVVDRIAPAPRVRRPNLNFIAMGLRIGDEIMSLWGHRATIEDERHVRMNGEVMTLGRASKVAFGEHKQRDNINSVLWSHEGINLRQLYCWWTGALMKAPPRRLLGPQP